MLVQESLKMLFACRMVMAGSAATKGTMIRLMRYMMDLFNLFEMDNRAD